MAQIVVRHRIAGLKGESAAERSHRILRSVQGRQRIAHIVVGVGIVGLQSQGPAIAGHRALHVAQGLQGEGEMGMIGRLAIVEGDGRGCKFHGGLGLALLQSNHAQQMQGVRAIRMDAQDFAVKRGGLIQLPRLMQAHRFGERDPNIETRQGCAFPRLPHHLCSAPQCSIFRMLKLVAAEALTARIALDIDFV